MGAHMMLQPLRRSLFAAWTLLALVVVAGGCQDCFGPPASSDAGGDAGSSGDAGGPRPDGGGDPDPDAGPGPDASTGPQCSEETEGYGEPCAAQMGDPLCGQFLCNMMTDELFCWDPDGPNECGVCGDLDDSEGEVGAACGEFGCGIAVCSDDGTATICEGDHPRNQCGGCADILPASHMPGQVCSSCGTGIRTCSRDLNSLVCWRGRAPDNACGGCDRCVLFHAWMDERHNGGYVRSGTLAILEDIGDGTRQLVFDPLVEGPGANALVYTQVALSTTPNPLDGSFTFLTPDFAASTDGLGADPYRQYSLANVPNLGQYRFVVLYDFFLGEVISAGELIAGPPALIPGEEDAGPPVVDAGAVVDAGSTDAGAPRDAGGTDAGAGLDAGAIVDAGTADAGAPRDAGSGGG